MESLLKKWILALTLVSVMLIGASLPFILIPGPINEASTPTPVGLDQPTEQLLLIVLDGVPQSVFDDKIGCRSWPLSPSKASRCPFILLN